MTYLLFAVALSLSAIAAYYAVMGLIAIFAAAVVPIAIMGTLLEVSKLTVASWLYQNWKKVPKLMKTYFTIALVVLMMLTSMGIFGFLSKAHLDQAVPTGEVSSKLSLIDEKIKQEKENLDASRKELNQLDQQVNETISRSGTATDATGDKGIRGVERSIAIRKGQQRDRERILKEIGASQEKIAKLQEERAPIATEVRKVEAEVGPIKYIAELIYGDQAQDEGFLEKAVRIVTLMIVAVFDPLAVLLLIAANWNLRNGIKQSWTSLFLKEPAKDFPSIEEIRGEDPEVKQFFERGKEVARALDAGEPLPEFTAPDTEVKEVEENPPEVQDWDKKFYDKVGSEIPEIEVEEPTIDEAPEHYIIRRGDVVTKEKYPDNKDVPPKTASFMRKMADFLRPTPSPDSIEKAVDDLQKK